MDLESRGAARSRPPLESLYRPLRSEDEIRLIRLETPTATATPADHDPNGMLLCSLVHVRRDEEAAYTALSYTWGDSTQQAPVCVDGTVVWIGVNLEGALRALRDHCAVRTVWADQLCIHQADDAEKSAQVQHMKEIYADAFQVVAYLGPATASSDAFMARLRQMGDAARSRTARRKLRRLYAKKKRLAGLAEDFDRFCKRPYWSRLWTIQEYAVAWDLKIVWGSSSIMAWQLDGAIEWIGFLEDNIRQRKLKKQKPLVGEVEMQKIFRSPALSFVQSLISRRWNYEYIDDRQPLLDALQTSLALEVDYNDPQCSDPRDRVFSLLGLVADAEHFGPFPDYSMSCEDVYEELARLFLKQGSLHVLSFCQFPKNPMSRPLSSWVVDWSMPLRYPCTIRANTYHFQASGDTMEKQIVTFPQPHLLNLWGFTFDSIEEVGSVWDPHWLTPLDLDATSLYLGEIRAFCEKSPRIQDDEPGKAAPAHIAVRERFETGNPEDRLNSYNLLLRMLEERKAKIESSFTADEEAFIDMYMTELLTLHTRRPFLSKTGYIGLVPEGCVAGDVLVLFFGATVPYVLRARDEGDYTLVGEAYVYGVMQGELVEEGDYPKENFTIY